MQRCSWLIVKVRCLVPGGVGAGGLGQGEVAGVHAEGDEEVDEDGEVEGPGAGDHLPQPRPSVRQLVLQV